MRFIYGLLVITAVLGLALPAQATSEVQSISYPAISADGETVYFTCWGDIWSAPRDGSEPARRLTVNVAYEGRPIPSPDGRQIAFLSDRFGDYDIFVMPEEGGQARRLTWDSKVDYLYDWKPDGSAILAYTMRQDLWGLCMYEIPLDGGPVVRISGPDHDDHVFPSYLGDEKHFVYARGPGDWSRVNHRGSDTYDLWTYDATTGMHTQLTDNDYKDYWPQPSPDGREVYFVADRDGCDNVYAINLATKETRKLTSFRKRHARWPRISSDGDEVVFELAGELWLVPAHGGKAEQVKVTFSDDMKHLMANTVDIPGLVDEVAVSPNNNYYALGVLGDIYILKNPDSYPPDEAPDQDLSRTHLVVDSPGREMHFSWHPEDLKLAYVSDRDGNYDVYIYDLVTREETRVTDTPADEWYPDFAPRGERLAFYSGNRRLMVHDLKDGTTELLHEGQLRNGPWCLGYDWAPDGNWIVLAEALLGYRAEIMLLNLDGSDPVNVSYNPHWSSSPKFSPDGKYIAYGQRTRDGAEIMLVELNPEPATYDTELLFPGDVPEEEEAEPVAEEDPATVDDTAAEETDEVVVEDAAAVAETAEGEADATAADGEADDEAVADEEEEEEDYEPVVIDLDRIHERARSVTPMAGEAYAPFFDPNSSYILFISLHENTEDWWTVTIDGGQMSRITPNTDADPVFSPDGSRLYFAEGGRLTYLQMSGSEAAGGGMVSVLSRISYDQYEIWEQMMAEGWRQLRDTFYDEDMLGVDWDDVLKRYLPRVRTLGTNDEYNRLYREMLGELGGSHLGFYSAGSDQEEPPDVTARFGVHFDERHFGDGWLVGKVINDSPADAPGSRLYVGDVITAVDGRVVDSGDNRSLVLNNLAGIPVTLEVLSGEAAVADGCEAEREVVIMPTTDGGMRQLEYLQWVADNRAMVYELGDQRFGYQHIQSNDGYNLAKFERELFTESAGKEALVLDMRFNGGGGIAEQIVEILDRRPFAIERHRGGEDSPQPSLLWDGPIVVLINAHCFSDAEITPWILQDLGLATILGEATGGNVIGTYDFTLMDGSYFRLPSWGWWRLNGMDMEGNGCQPDVYVHISPEAVATGGDNQIEAAVEFLKKVTQ